MLELIFGDIAEQDTDAIVNATSLGLVDGSDIDCMPHRRSDSVVMWETSGKYSDGYSSGSTRRIDISKSIKGYTRK